MKASFRPNIEQKSLEKWHKSLLFSWDRKTHGNNTSCSSLHLRSSNACEIPLQHALKFIILYVHKHLKPFEDIFGHQSCRLSYPVFIRTFPMLCNFSVTTFEILSCNWIQTKLENTLFNTWKVIKLSSVINLSWNCAKMCIKTCLCRIKMGGAVAPFQVKHPNKLRLKIILSRWYVAELGLFINHFVT